MAMTLSVGARRDAQRRPAESRARDTTRGRRAFVVDDDPTTQLLLGDLAGELGWQTERFATLTALRHALARDEPDLLILDDALPDGSGGDFVAEMRSQDRLRRLPVVICTGAVPARRRFLGRLAPVLAKPFDLFSFERIVLDVTGTASG
jgi:DNA-binding response OmpR family regulator